MLCPEVCKFPEPKIITSIQNNLDLETTKKTVRLNNFYRSLVIACPDENHTPDFIQEVATDDCDYYKVFDCPVTTFMESTFIEKFVKNGTLFALSADSDCIVQNCAAILPDGLLLVHIPEYIFQTLGLEGKKRPHNYYEIQIDLKNSTSLSKVRSKISKLENFDFYITWEPPDGDICPSSVAKYFFERNVRVQVLVPEVKKLSPMVTETPALEDVEPQELEEWIGMLAHDADLTPEHEYVSSYKQPLSKNAIKSTRISILIVKSFFTPSILERLCDKLTEYVGTRDMDNFWASLSYQGYSDSPWRWRPSTPRTFQAHMSSSTIFFTKGSNVLYSVGQLKFR